MSIFKAWQVTRKADKFPWSQEYAAGELGFGQSAMNQYLNGRIPLNPEAASKFALLLECPVHRFSETVAKEIAGIASGLSPSPAKPESVTKDRRSPDINVKELREPEPAYLDPNWPFTKFTRAEFMRLDLDRRSDAEDHIELQIIKYVRGAKETNSM